MVERLDGVVWMIEGRKGTDMKDDYEFTTHHHCGSSFTDNMLLKRRDRT
jgi:hypothetical protein